jgi:hypothetical protein
MTKIILPMLIIFHIFPFEGISTATDEWIKISVFFSFFLKKKRKPEFTTCRKNSVDEMETGESGRMGGGGGGGGRQAWEEENVLNWIKLNWIAGGKGEDDGRIRTDLPTTFLPNTGDEIH